MVFAKEQYQADGISRTSKTIAYWLLRSSIKLLVYGASYSSTSHKAEDSSGHEGQREGGGGETPDQPVFFGVKDGSDGDGKKPWSNQTLPSAKLRENPLLIEMAELLDDLDKLMEKVKEKKLTLVLVVDLDDSWVQHPAIDLDGTKLDDQGKIEDRRVVQHFWFDQLGHFFNHHKANIILIYNTARLSDKEVRNFEGKLKEKEDEEQCNAKRLGRTAERQRYFIFSPDHNDRAIKFNPIFSTEETIAIPIADILISGSGVNVELSGHYSLYQREVEDVNEKLLEYSHRRTLQLTYSTSIDYQLKKMRFLTPFHYATLVPSNTLYPSFMSLVASDIDHPPRFIQDMEATYAVKYVTVPEYTDMTMAQLKRILYYSPVVNKGVALNVVVAKLQTILAKDNLSPLVYCIGDSLSDLPFLLPSHELKAIGEMTEAALVDRNQKMAPLGVSALDSMNTDWWAKSFLLGTFEADKFTPEVRESVKHEKLLRIKAGWGVIEVIKSLNADLRQRLLDPDLPALDLLNFSSDSE